MKKMPEILATLHRQSWRVILVFLFLMGLDTNFSFPQEDVTHREAFLNSLSIQPDLESEEAQRIFDQLKLINLENGRENDTGISVIVLGDSLSMADSFLESEDYPNFTVDNRSVLGGRFGYYGYPFQKNDATKIAQENIDKLQEDLQQLDDPPDFAILFFGRNDCQTVNTTLALEYISEKESTGEISEKDGFTYTWIQSIYDLLDVLKDLSIIPVIVTSTPMEKEGHCDANGNHINRVFAEIARREELPLIVPALTDYMLRPQKDGYMFDYSLTFGKDALAIGFLRANSDGLHIPPNKYDELNALLFGTLCELNNRMGLHRCDIKHESGTQSLSTQRLLP